MFFAMSSEGSFTFCDGRYSSVAVSSVQISRLSPSPFCFLIEAAFGLVAQQSALDHLRQELRHDEHFALFIFGKRFVQVLDDVSEDVEADEIKRAERRALRPAHCRAGDLVDFFDRVTILEHRLDREQRAERADAIGDEVRPVLRRHHAFAESLIEKAEQEAGDFRLGPFGANDFDEVQVARRIEKVDAEKVCLESSERPSASR